MQVLLEFVEELLSLHVDVHVPVDLHPQTASELHVAVRTRELGFSAALEQDL